MPSTTLTLPTPAVCPAPPQVTTTPPPVWPAVPAGKVPAPLAGGYLDFIGAMVGKQIPSLKAKELYAVWKRRRMASHALSCQLADRLRRASQGKVDLRGGKEAIIDLLNQSLIEEGLILPPDFQRHDVEVRDAFARNSFFPVIFEEKTFQPYRRLECFLAVEPRGIPLAERSYLGDEPLTTKIISMGESTIGGIAQVVVKAATEAILLKKERITMEILDSMEWVAPSEARNISMEALGSLS